VDASEKHAFPVWERSNVLGPELTKYDGFFGQLGWGKDTPSVAPLFTVDEGDSDGNICCCGVGLVVINA
jgi:hypothetical protein